MDNAEALNYCRARFKTYTWHKLNLQSLSKESFDEAAKNLIEDIFEDANIYYNLQKEPLAKPVMDMFQQLERYSYSILEFFNLYKSLFVV